MLPIETTRPSERPRGSRPEREEARRSPLRSPAAGGKGGGLQSGPGRLDERGKAGVLDRGRNLRRRIGRAHPSARPARKAHDRAPARHDRRGGGPPDAALRAGARPADLDGLRGLRRAEPAVQTLAAKVLQFDLALADYGPEATPLRLQLREGLGKTLDEVWAADQWDANFAGEQFRRGAAEHARAAKPLWLSCIRRHDEQTQALAAARAAGDAIGQSRLQMSFALSAPGLYPLMFTVVGWVRSPVPGLRAHVEGERDLGARRRRRRGGGRVRLLSDPRAVEPLFRASSAPRPRRSSRCSR